MYTYIDMRFLYACVFVFVVKIFFGLHLWTIFASLQLKNNSFPNSATKFGRWISCHMPNCTSLRKENCRMNKNDKRFLKYIYLCTLLHYYYYYKAIISTL